MAYSACYYPNTYCPDLSYPLNSSISCKEGVEETKVTITSKDACYNYSKPEQSCKENDCEPGYFCDKVCKKAPSLGEACDYYCSPGLVCNRNKCIKYFSLTEGSYSETKFACESGRIENKTCIQEDKSLSLPQACKSNKDCVGTGGVLTTCVCVYNE